MSEPSSPLRIPVAAWLAVAGLVVVSAWLGWRALGKAEPGGSGAPGAGGRPPSTVIFQRAIERAVVQEIPVTGTLRAAHRAEVAAREPAAVASIEVEEGDAVEAGDVLARLDGRRLAAQVAEARAAVTAAEAQLAQREAERERAAQDQVMMAGLWEKRAVAESEYLDSVRGAKVAASAEAAAREAIAAAQKRLDLLVVREGDLEVTAPFAGRVVARHAEVGEWLREGDPVATVVSTGELEAWLELPERHVATLQSDPPAQVTLRVPGRAEPITATELAVVPEVGGRSRRFNLIAQIDAPEGELAPGASVSGLVPLGSPAARVVVSSDAVLASYAGTYVFVAAPPTAAEAPSIAKRVPVEVLFERGGEAVLAAGGLAPGDRVIVEGNERLFPNSPVDPHPWEETRGGGAKAGGAKAGGRAEGSAEGIAEDGVSAEGGGAADGGGGAGGGAR